METLLTVLSVFLMMFGVWIVTAVGQAIHRSHQRALLREREKTERLRLRLEAQERAQERADRIYLDAVERHTGPLPDPDEAPQAAPERREE
ncbi:hypothetical protein NI17_005205 [Thermobifida halotolerans]|uniref:Uncharacterized protein n=1 Tax=Thermobifida halotolerans TaxID=483545 RepID=A0A399G707_9ACTN|nr:hypothetical protein [Thermobifida halotolerans]UOE20615.1 hypothetical protein NI17_005205 [Thermobifida halotolerans]